VNQIPRRTRDPKESSVTLANQVTPIELEYMDDRVWIKVTDRHLIADDVLSWVARPSCGAIVSFFGVVRDHSDNRPLVTSLTYEMYPEEAVTRLRRVAESAQTRWPTIGGLALLHRSGTLTVGEVSVVVGVSTPHRAQAFEAGEYCIDTLKRTVPVWKLESWSGGTDWSSCAHDIEDVDP
jgi:molybdopterin synthase catalytic subunit